MESIAAEKKQAPTNSTNLKGDLSSESDDFAFISSGIADIADIDQSEAVPERYIDTSLSLDKFFEADDGEASRESSSSLAFQNNFAKSPISKLFQGSSSPSQKIIPNPNVNVKKQSFHHPLFKSCKEAKQQLQLMLTDLSILYCREISTNLLNNCFFHSCFDDLVLKPSSEEEIFSLLRYCHLRYKIWKNNPAVGDSQGMPSVIRMLLSRVQKSAHVKVIINEMLKHLKVASRLKAGEASNVAKDIDLFKLPDPDFSCWILKVILSHELNIEYFGYCIDKLISFCRTNNSRLRSLIFDVLCFIAHLHKIEFPNTFHDLLSWKDSFGVERNRILKSSYLSNCLILSCTSKKQETLCLLAERITSKSISLVWNSVLDSKCNFILEMKCLKNNPQIKIQREDQSPSEKSESSSENPFVKIYENLMPFFKVDGLEENCEYYFRLKVQDFECDLVKIFKTLPSLTWDDKFSLKGKSDLKFCNDNLSCIVHSNNDKWKTILCNTAISFGSFSWQIRIDSTSKGYIFIGVSAKNADLETYVGGDALGWGFFLYDRSYYHNRVKAKPPSKISDSFVVGDILTISLNCDNGTLSYSKNGSKTVNKLISNIPTGIALFPTVSLLHKGDSVTISDDFTLRDIPFASKGINLTGKETDAYEELTLYFDICANFSKSASSNEGYPSFLIGKSFSGWNPWLKTDVRNFQFQSGASIEVDVSALICGLYGIYPGQKFSTSTGEGKILGLDASSKKVVIKLDDREVHELWDKLKLETIKLQNPERLFDYEEKWKAIEKFRDESSSLTLNDFGEVANLHRNYSLDYAIVQKANQLSSNL
jgi:hypothetical protein